MAEQERKQRRGETPSSGDGGQPNSKITGKGEKLKEDMDKLMDEIDGVLEENAEEFIKSFVQRGGE
ncbi:MAG TPA: ubiquitin-like protein Pup [Candidatus Methylomirabilis sp.]|nr:ubiquitin-like protein Pup [Candidatus Methylomirabilis sp.]